MTPEEVLAASLSMPYKEFDAKLEKMSRKERKQTDDSIDKVTALMTMAMLSNQQAPQEFARLAEEMGFEGVEEILRQSKDCPYSEHRHQCPDCKTIFQHDPWKIEDENGTKAHDCPSCKTHVTLIYRGDEKPTVLHHGETNVQKQGSKAHKREVQESA